MNEIRTLAIGLLTRSVCLIHLTIERTNENTNIRRNCQQITFELFFFFPRFVFDKNWFVSLQFFFRHFPFVSNSLRMSYLVSIWSTIFRSQNFSLFSLRSEFLFFLSSFFCSFIILPIFFKWFDTEIES